MGVVVRRGCRDDLGWINAFDPDSLGDPHRAALIDGALASGQLLVAEVDGPVGYVVVREGALFGRDFIELCFVAEAHRRSGIGRTLMRAAVEGASTTRVFSSTNRSNTAMRSYFDGDGWTFSGELDGLDDGDPEMFYFRDRSSTP